RGPEQEYDFVSCGRPFIGGQGHESDFECPVVLPECQERSPVEVDFTSLRMDALYYCLTALRGLCSRSR
ncbi:hypothetical protein BaRGS_00020020, partial [Batillaria attramentaria]